MYCIWNIDKSVYWEANWNPEIKFYENTMKSSTINVRISLLNIKLVISAQKGVLCALITIELIVQKNDEFIVLEQRMRK